MLNHKQTAVALMTGLIAALITSSSTFTVAYTQHMQMPCRSYPPHPICQIALGIALTYLPAHLQPDTHGLIGTTRDNPQQNSLENSRGLGLGIGVLHKFTP
jgi:hypothetical protein